MIRHGEIHWVMLDPVRGREQRGRRPAVVVSADSINRLPLLVTVVIGTDALNIPRDYPSNVRVPARESGLPLDTVFMGFQIRSLDLVRFRDPATGVIAPAGRLPAPRMQELEGALRTVLSL